MKYRTDFVTNSSSTCFLLGKKGDGTHTVDFVFNLLKEFYRKHLEKHDEILRLMKEHPEYHLKVVKDKHFHCHYFDYDEEVDLPESLEYYLDNNNNFFYDDAGWLECKTYKEYEQLWKENAPFVIADFEDSAVYSLLDEFTDTKHEERKSIDDSYMHAIFEYKVKGFPCKKCPMSQNCYEHLDQDCISLQNFLKGNQTEYATAALDLLGKACVYSTRQKLPEFMENELIVISNYYSTWI